MTGLFDGAAAIADAVLYEGYLLYPYRASSDKNRMRFQFGVLVPPEAQAVTGEHASSQTQCLCEPGDGATVSVRLRFLHLRARTVEVIDGDGYLPVDRFTVGDDEYVSWDEAIERHVDAAVPMADLLAGDVVVDFEIPACTEPEPLTSRSGLHTGRLVRRCAAVRGQIRLGADALDGPYGGVRLTAVVVNTTEIGDVATRDDALPGALIGAHTLIALDSGMFLSLTEPPEWARPAAAVCVNMRTWPVLVGMPAANGGGPGGAAVVLSAPIILSDFPSIAPESPGPLFDGTEIDEILTLRTMTLTDAEKREARATDARAGAMLDRIDTMPPELLDRLHGTVRYLRQVAGPEPDAGEPGVPWWDPAADASADPERDGVVIDGVTVAKGSRVRLAPRLCGSDAQDMFLTGLPATVRAVLSDVDGGCHVAVTLDDDPAADVQHAQGRYRYFDPSEIEPIGVTPISHDRIEGRA